jgi:hypothetical protein
MLWNDKNKVRFHMQQHFWHSGMVQQQIIFTDTIWKQFLIRNKKIVLSGNGLPVLSNQDATVDILIIKNKVKLNDLLTKIYPKQVIITSSVKPYMAKAMKDVLNEKNIPYTCIGDSVAFQLSL